MPEGGCSAADPCDPALVATLVEGVTVVGPFVLWLLPRHARAVAAALLAGWAGSLLLEPAGLPVVELLAAAVVLTAWTLVVDRVERDRRRGLAEVAAGAPHGVWPGPVPTPPPWEGLRLAGALGLLSLVLLGVALSHVREAREQAAAAPRDTAVVTAHGDDGYLVTLDVRGRAVELDTWRAADYPVGSRQPVLLLEDGVRLAAEPPDPFGALALAQVAAAAALVRGVRARRRVVQVRDLLTRPQPVLAVQVLPHPEGAVLLPADAGPEQGPALALVPVVALSELDEDPDTWDDDHEDDDPPEQQPALLWGLPLPGEAAALRRRDGELLLPLGPNSHPPSLGAVDVPVPVASGPLPADEDVERVLRLRPGSRPLAVAAAVLAVPVLAVVVATADGLLGALLRAALVADVERVLRLRPGSRPLAVAAAVLAVPVLAVVVATADGLLGALLRAALVADVGLGGLLRLLSRVELADDALVAHGPLRTRVLPWRDLRGVDVVSGGLVATTREGEELRLPLPGTWSLVLRREAHAVRLAAAAAVLRSRAGTPGEARAAVEPRPFLPAYAVALALALLLGLVLR